MRILFIGESYLPQLCGMTAVTRYLAEGLVSRGHKVGIATQSHFDNDKNAKINQMWINVRCYNIANVPLWVWIMVDVVIIILAAAYIYNRTKK